jgi:hypothetical protein
VDGSPFKRGTLAGKTVYSAIRIVCDGVQYENYSLGFTYATSLDYGPKIHLLGSSLLAVNMASYGADYLAADGVKTLLYSIGGSLTFQDTCEIFSRTDSIKDTSLTGDESYFAAGIYVAIRYRLFHR